MASICPKDLKPCPDDLCRGSGTCVITRGELLERCGHCGQAYSRDYSIDCACDYDDSDDDEDVCHHGVSFSERCEDCESSPCAV